MVPSFVALTLFLAYTHTALMIPLPFLCFSLSYHLTHTNTSSTWHCCASLVLNHRWFKYWGGVFTSEWKAACYLCGLWHTLRLRKACYEHHDLWDECEKSYIHCCARTVLHPFVTHAYAYARMHVTYTLYLKLLVLLESDVTFFIKGIYPLGIEFWCHFYLKRQKMV